MQGLRWQLEVVVVRNRPLADVIGSWARKDGSSAVKSAHRSKRRGEPWFPGMVDRQADLVYGQIMNAIPAEATA